MKNEQDRKVRMTEIAQMSNVSTTTVSRVMNHPELVNEWTRKRVLQVMEQMNCGGAQRTRSKIILVIVPDISNSFYAQIYDGIYAAADRKGYQFIIRQCVMDRLPSRDSIRGLCQATNASGILLLTSATVEEMRSMESVAPVVQCCECLTQNEDFTYVTIDDYRAEYNMTQNLVKSGRKKFAFVNQIPAYKFARERRRGFEDAVREAGLEINPAWMIELSSFNFLMSRSAISQLFRSHGDVPDAIVTVSDIYGVAAIKAVKDNGFSVPDDVAVTGFDNLELCHLIEPSLTTVSQPTFRMGNLACELLIGKIEDPEAKTQQIVLDTEIIVRGSTL